MERSEALITERVRSLIADRGVSGSELARRIGATQSYVSRRIRGDVPWRAGELVKIAAALGCTAADLLPDTVSADAA